MSEQCITCHKPATKLCDAYIGAEIAGYVRQRNTKLADNRFYAVMNLDSELFTCDAPVCDDHALHGGTRFFCKSNRNKSEVTVIDLCPAKHPEPVPMSKEECESLRRSIHAGLRRSRIQRESN